MRWIFIPSPLLCVHLRPAPPVSAHTPLQLPAEAALSFWLSPNQGTLVRLRHLNHRLTQPAPDTTPAATLLARLFLFITTSLTLVGRRCVRACQACPKLPLRHSRQCATTHRFRSFEYRSDDLSALDRRFPIWLRLCCRLLARACAPLIVELFTVCVLLAEPRKLSASGSSVSPPGSSRRQRALYEPVELCTRLALRLWSESHRGI